jgi:nitroimidazol reductase NimA-like FMN-containing flavoprotein (pyridoxamine 5'-phosphate oxidase superfamily)
MTSRGTEILDLAECKVLLRDRTLGRIAVHLADDLVIFPVYYAMLEGDIVFRTDPGTKLSAAVLGMQVAFEVDNASPPWSVLVRGHAREVRDQREEIAARARLGHDWPAGERDSIVRINVESITGRRLLERV